MTIIGTICHNDDDATMPNHRRIEVWMDADGTIWADRDSPHRPEVPKARNTDHARDIATRVWSGQVWGLKLG